MIALLFSFIFFAQGVTSANNGTITGIIQTAAGKPAAGIRVAAVIRPDAAAGAGAEASSAGLAQTDEQGRYRLEDIPPGNYYIAAGRVTFPTYYPGALEMSKGKPIAIAAGAAVANINITLDDASVRPPDSAVDVSAIAGLTLPVQVQMEGSARQPVFANGKSVVVRFTRKQAGEISGEISDIPLNDTVLNLPVPNSLPGYEYRITVENLPSGYAVRSITQDGVDLANNTLKITAKNFVQAPIPVTGGTAPAALSKDVQIAYGAGGPMIPLQITLAARSAATGVRVTGRVESKGSWDLGLTNAAGSSTILFADGSFECSGVSSGRHLVLLHGLSSPERTLAASFVMGNKDIENVVVDDAIQPTEIQYPAKTPSASSVIPLPWIHGHVVDAMSKEPVLGGSVTLTGKVRNAFPIDSEGQFDIPGLLPGTYDLTIEGSRHAAIRQKVVVGDDDVSLNIAANRAD